MNQIRKMNQPKDFFLLMRPFQWTKNGFVLTGLLFGSQFFQMDLVQSVLLAFVAFCLVSSTVYIINDILDSHADRLHPKKSLRPIPSGKITIPAALIFALCLAILGFACGAAASGTVLVILLSYFALNLAYSYRLKYVVIIDVFCIATGFMLRILAGTVGVGIPPSKWLLLCGLLLTLFLALVKRRAEIPMLRVDESKKGSVLDDYNSEFPDIAISVCASGIVITYSLYTMSPHTISIHHTEDLFYTVPLVIYGIFRYLYLLYRHQQGGDPTMDLMQDPHIVATFMGWVALTAWILYN
jgi:4-hydroxybenzoate polyprenyltransferase